MKSFLPAIFTFIAVVATFGQVDGAFDKFILYPEDEYMARVQYVQQEAARIGGHSLYLIDAPPGNPYLRYLHERLIRAVVAQLKLEPSRFTVRFAKDLDGKVEAYVLQNAAADVPAEIVPRDFRLDGQTQPIRFASDRFPYQILYVPFDRELYARLLIANPNMTGRIVIYGRRDAQFRREVNRELRNMTAKYKVPRSRIRFFSNKNACEAGGYCSSGTEFWIDPPKNAGK